MSRTSLAYYLSTKQWNVSAHLDKLEEKGRIRRKKTQRTNLFTLYYDTLNTQAFEEFLKNVD